MRTYSLRAGPVFAAALLVLLAGRLAAADISTHTFRGNCALPDTGQTGSYTVTFGEDHDYSPTGKAPSYTVYNPVGVSSVTVDNRTGLMWITKHSDTGLSSSEIWENAIAACESLSYAGYTDWRLPNLRELASIVDFSAAAPAINTAYFQQTFSNAYWSSTTNVSSNTEGWTVSFNDGSVNYAGKTFATNYRCVRGGP